MHSRTSSISAARSRGVAAALGMLGARRLDALRLSCLAIALILAGLGQPAAIAQSPASLPVLTLVPLDTLRLSSNGLRGLAFEESTVYMLMTSNPGLSVPETTIVAAILRWDRSTGAVDTLSAEPDAFDTGLAFDGEGLWAGGYRVGGAESLYRIEVRDGSLTATLPASGYHPAGLVWDDEYLWQVDADARQISRIEIEEGKLSRRIDLPGFFPTGLAYDGYHFWSADAATGRIFRIRAYNGRVDGFVDPEIFLRPGEFVTLGWDGSFLWTAAASDSFVVRYDVLR